MKPTISLLMCNYNNEPFIRRAIESVLNQTYQNFELVITDDCSTDNSVEIIREYAEKDNRISFYKQEKNGGYGQALYDTILRAKADYAGIIDSDDALEPDALEIMIGRLNEKPQLAGLYSQLWVCDENLNPQKIQETTRKIPKGTTYLEYGRLAMTHFFVFDRLKFIEKGNIDRSFRNALDQDWYYKVEEIGEVDFVEKPLYYYRVSPTGLSQGIKKKYITAKDHHQIRKKAVKRRNISGFKKYRILTDSRVDLMYKKFNWLASEKSPMCIFPLIECLIKKPRSTVQALIGKLKK